MVEKKIKVGDKVIIKKGRYKNNVGLVLLNLKKKLLIQIINSHNEKEGLIFTVKKEEIKW